MLPDRPGTSFGASEGIELTQTQFVPAFRRSLFARGEAKILGLLGMTRQLREKGESGEGMRPWLSLPLCFEANGEPKGHPEDTKDQ